jgi:hypothetical protein
MCIVWRKKGWRIHNRKEPRHFPSSTDEAHEILRYKMTFPKHTSAQLRKQRNGKPPESTQKYSLNT